MEAEREEKAKKQKDKKATIEEPEIRYLTPDPVQLELESGRLFQFEIGKYVKELSSDHTREEVEELKEKNEEDRARKQEPQRGPFRMTKLSEGSVETIVCLRKKRRKRRKRNMSDDI